LALHRKAGAYDEQCDEFAAAGWPCPGIDVEPGHYSGCSGGDDCPICGGDKLMARGARNMVQQLSQRLAEERDDG
jgi:hypothetical protein